MKYLFYSILSLLLLASCQNFNDFDELEVTDGSAEFAVPIASGELSISTLLENFDQYTTIDIDPDGLIRLRYRGDVTERNSSTVFEAVDAILGGVDIIVTDSVLLVPFELSNILSIDQADLKSGFIAFGVTNNGSEPQDFRLFFPEIRRTSNFNDMLEYTTTVAPNTTFVDTFFMEGFSILPTEDKEIFIKYEAFNANNERVLVDFLGMSINNLTFSYAEGDLGPTNFTGDRDSIEIEFFEEWRQGEVFFKDPVIRILTENSFGLPPVSDTKLFRVITVDGDSLDLISPAITNGVVFPFPMLDEVGQVKRDTFEFNSSNSNIESILGSNPVLLEYEIDVLVQPDLAPDQRGFITDDSYFIVGVEAELPLHGTARGFEVADTFEIAIPEYEGIGDVEFKIVTENGLPVNIETQGYFLAPDGTVIDSLLNERNAIFLAAPVDAEGKPTQTSRQEEFIKLSPARYQSVRAADRLVLINNFSTTENASIPVKIFADQRSEVRIGLRFTRE